VGVWLRANHSGCAGGYKTDHQVGNADNDNQRRATPNQSTGLTIHQTHDSIYPHPTPPLHVLMRLHIRRRVLIQAGFIRLHSMVDGESVLPRNGTRMCRLGRDATSDGPYGKLLGITYHTHLVYDC
jgi:hypothetical protein